jgi:valyl-tRNA synthetase
LLHPFAPFISEELYQKLPIRNQACITDEYPTIYKDKKFLNLASGEVAKEIELIKEIVREARTIRSENRISPAVEIPLFLVPSDDWSQKVVLAHRESLESLIKTSKFEVVGQTSLSKAAVAQVILNRSQVQVVIPLEGLVDLDEEIHRLEKQLEKLSKDKAVLETKLRNESFVKNADPDVVEENRMLLAQTKSRYELVAGALERLKN